MNKFQNPKEKTESQYSTEGMILEKLVARFRIGSPIINYFELKESIGSPLAKNIDEALRNLKDHSIIYSSDGINYSITETGISEFERRKNAGLLF